METSSPDTLFEVTAAHSEGKVFVPAIKFACQRLSRSHLGLLRTLTPRRGG